MVIKLKLAIVLAVLVGSSACGQSDATTTLNSPVTSNPPTATPPQMDVGIGSGLSQLDFANLQGSWRVISVEHDGELIQAQVGQRVGDVITFSEGPAVVRIT